MVCLFHFIFYCNYFRVVISSYSILKNIKYILESTCHVSCHECFTSKSFWLTMLFKCTSIFIRAVINFISTKQKDSNMTYLFSMHPFHFWFRFTSVLDVESYNLALLDDHVLKTLANDVWLDCQTYKNRQEWQKSQLREKEKGRKAISKPIIYISLPNLHLAIIGLVVSLGSPGPALLMARTLNS